MRVEKNTSPQKVNIILVHSKPKQKDATISNMKFHEYSTSDLGVICIPTGGRIDDF